MRDINFRYFLAVEPPVALRHLLLTLSRIVGQFRRRVEADRLHLTLCVIAELVHQDRLIAEELDLAFAQGLPPSCPIHLGKVLGRPGGAAISSIGCQHEIRRFYLQLLNLLVRVGIFPLHRRSGLHAHITLGYDPCDFKADIPVGWVPDELLLIESEVGNSIHNVLRRWPLTPPLQYSLPFGSEIARQSRAAEEMAVRIARLSGQKSLTLSGKEPA